MPRRRRRRSPRGRRQCESRRRNGRWRAAARERGRVIPPGYLTGEPSGKWDSATQDALKRFQEEQNLTPTGKITSLSLIALGLGPKRSPVAANTAQTPPEAQQIP
jgi:peptidoglycan hydrolase-like protein with peptidoglycan-binding domain